MHFGREKEKVIIGKEKNIPVGRKVLKTERPKKAKVIKRANK